MRTDIDIEVCKRVMAALMLLASGIDALGKLTTIMTVIGYVSIITAIAYIVYIGIMVALIKSRES